MTSLRGRAGEGYKRMMNLSPAGCAGTDEVGTIAALLIGADGAFIKAATFWWMAG